MTYTNKRKHTYDILYSTILYSTLLCSTVNDTVLPHTIPYYTLLPAGRDGSMTSSAPAAAASRRMRRGVPIDILLY